MKNQDMNHDKNQEHDDKKKNDDKKKIKEPADKRGSGKSSEQRAHSEK